ncbi:hypothetical protein ElyMa_002687000 [Elysia marginata]|uniref:Uncharacterized protein n=1 Tax=Elysia marginata TaxID=1093978 RepID=A0AAV4HB78_9GAST|nr:hypothetical protein ElyMa_002687000 [Elysia marginata]
MARVWTIALCVIVLLLALTLSQSEDSQGTNTGSGGRKARRESRQQQKQAQNSTDVDDNDNSSSSSNDDDGDTSGGGRRRRIRGRGAAADDDDEDDYVFSWQQDVGADKTVTKTVEISKEGGIIIIKSKDEDLDDLGFVESVTSYDYTRELSVVAIQPKGRHPCFLTEETLSYTELLEGVKQLRGTVANRSEAIIFDGTGAPLSREDESMIFTSNPQLKQTCGRGNVVVLAELGGKLPFIFSLLR